ncbi:MAG: gamma-glutamylcyclotransferase [Rhodospirillales bacterium]|nr:gamma-glutamylcyclotransferase [Rhodospirillales bacterium]MBO6786549.1 gamma-glutamylcyclotransferase [Rhodospirillales bacterium]
MSNYFFYGTLQDPEIAREILGRPLSGCSPTAGVLPGYKRVYAAGATYPGLVTDPDGEVDGILVRRISPLEVSRLSRYEGKDYKTADLEVRLGDGSFAEARVFLPLPTLRMSETPWELDVWRRKEKRRFMAGLRRNVLI